MQVIEVYVDASCNHQKGVGVAGMWIPILDMLELKEYYGKVTSTKIEIDGASHFINTLPHVDNVVYNINTDCQNIAENGVAALNISPRNDLTFTKQNGHGKVGVVNPEFRKIDKATRAKMRSIINSGLHNPEGM